MPFENRDLLDDFDAYYRVADHPAMRRIERAVLGGDYGSSGDTTRRQADRLSDMLGLGPGKLLLDLGTGAGWPGIYLAVTTGCALAAVDLPFGGLLRARRRMEEESVRGMVAAAPGAVLPFRDDAFDAATSSDVFC